MKAREPRFPSEEYARRGDEIYGRCVKPRLRPGDENKLVAIDIESEDFEIDEDALTATNRLCVRQPDAQVWLARVGHRAAYRLGFRATYGELRTEKVNKE